MLVAAWRPAHPPCSPLSCVVLWRNLGASSCCIMQQQALTTVGALNKPSSQNTQLNFRCDHLSAGINRLLGNNTYEAAFPPHEVTNVFFLCLPDCTATSQNIKRTRKYSPASSLSLVSLGQLQEPTPHQDTRRPEPPAPTVWALGSLGNVVQIPAAGSHQVTGAQPTAPRRRPVFLFLVPRVKRRRVKISRGFRSQWEESPGY